MGPGHARDNCSYIEFHLLSGIVFLGYWRVAPQPIDTLIAAERGTHSERTDETAGQHSQMRRLHSFPCFHQHHIPRPGDARQRDNRDAGPGRILLGEKAVIGGSDDRPSLAELHVEDIPALLPAIGGSRWRAVTAVG